MDENTTPTTAVTEEVIVATEAVPTVEVAETAITEEVLDIAPAVVEDVAPVTAETAPEAAPVA